MGCGSSRSAAVAPQRTSEAWITSTGEKTLTSSQTGKPILNEGSRGLTSSEDNNPGSIVSVTAANKHKGEVPGSLGSSSRTNSADSTSSKANSSDSGLGEEYAHVITEKSDEDKQTIAEVPDGVQSTELAIEGRKLTTPAHQGHRKRLTFSSHRPPHSHDQHPTTASLSPIKASRTVSFDPKAVKLNLPDSPSIIQRPVSRSGMAFEVFLGGNGDDTGERGSRMKTPGVMRLERRRKELATKKQLLEQQRMAEQRRKVSELYLLSMSLYRCFSIYTCTLKHAPHKYNNINTRQYTCKFVV